jgi:hypothetical protein
MIQSCLTDFNNLIELQSNLNESISPKSLEIIPCDLKTVRKFIEENHYSHNINGVTITQCFAVLYNNRIVGGAIYGLVSTTAWKKFSDDTYKVLELRRFVLSDGCGKTSESYVISKTLKWIKQNLPNVDTIVSYADPEYNHTGTIYRASNFEYLGLGKSTKVFYDTETGKTYHPRTLSTKYKGDYQPFVKRLKEKEKNGLLKIINRSGKHCFIYKLKRKPSDFKRRGVI